MSPCNLFGDGFYEKLGTLLAPGCFLAAPVPLKTKTSPVGWCCNHPGGPSSHGGWPPIFAPLDPLGALRRKNIFCARGHMPPDGTKKSRAKNVTAYARLQNLECKSGMYRASSRDEAVQTGSGETQSDGLGDEIRFHRFGTLLTAPTEEKEEEKAPPQLSAPYSLLVFRPLQT